MHEEQKKNADKNESSNFEKYTPVWSRKQKAETIATRDKPTKVLKEKEEMNRKGKIKKQKQDAWIGKSTESAQWTNASL